MIEITSFLHAERLREIIGRWFRDELEPGDALAVKEIVNFNDLLVRRWLRELANGLFLEVHGVAPDGETIRRKGELKDFVARHPTHRTPRIAALIDQYRSRPADFYPEAPIDGRLYFLRRGVSGAGEGESCLLVGGARMKRFRRIAEKGARKVSDYVYRRIRENAENIARARARDLGIPYEDMESTDEQLLREFRSAEEAIREALRLGRFVSPELAFPINDVAGLKLVGGESVQRALLEAIDGARHIRLLEKEVHRGVYNGTNLTVEVDLDPATLVAPPSEVETAVLGRRGLATDDLALRLEAFVGSARPVVRGEIILSSFDEFVESEFGRAMHEQRILTQRHTRIYSGLLARNAEYLLTYLFAFATSPKTSLDTLPVKLWGRYLTDYVDDVLRVLYGAEVPVLPF